MAGPDDPFHNPYRAPEYSRQATAPQQHASLEDVRTLQRCRWRMRTFGGLALVFSLLWVVAGLAISQRLEHDAGQNDRLRVVVGLVWFMGGIWLLVGLGSCYLQTWAVRVGLTLGYLGLLGNIARLNPCSLVLFGLVIGLGHVAIRAAGDCRERGLTLWSDPRRPASHESSEFGL